jgi:hypothetical protein
LDPLCIRYKFPNIMLGQDHPQGQGKVQQSNCHALFDLYIPFDMVQYPYICLVTRGEHNHHPPYPTRMPSDIANDVVEALRQTDIMIMTPRMLHTLYKYVVHILIIIGRFILSPQCRQLLHKYDKLTLRAIHASLNIEDRITALIRKERLLQYPDGTSLAGKYRMLSIYIVYNWLILYRSSA